jgi:hypothetical protein
MKLKNLKIGQTIIIALTSYKAWVKLTPAVNNLAIIVGITKWYIDHAGNLRFKFEIDKNRLPEDLMDDKNNYTVKIELRFGGSIMEMEGSASQVAHGIDEIVIKKIKADDKKKIMEIVGL